MPYHFSQVDLCRYGKTAYRGFDEEGKMHSDFQGNGDCRSMSRSTPCRGRVVGDASLVCVPELHLGVARARSHVKIHEYTLPYNLSTQCVLSTGKIGISLARPAGSSDASIFLRISVVPVSVVRVVLAT